MQILKNRVLVTGAYGLLGGKLVEQLRQTHEVVALVRRIDNARGLPDVAYVEGDIADYDGMLALARRLQPRTIFNAAAYTNVDGSEANREACWRTNVEAVAYLAKAAKIARARLIHVSTDYVFDGTAGPYRESDRPNPLGFYGKSKLAGENELISSGADFAIVRTMVLYGASPTSRPNFATWVLNSLQQEKTIRVVDDQFGNPTLADELAAALIQISRIENLSGIFHVSGREIVNRYQFAVEIARTFGLDSSRIEPVKTAALQQRAPRPLKSGFIIEKAEKEVGIQMSDVRGALQKFKQQMNKR